MVWRRRGPRRKVTAYAEAAAGLRRARKALGESQVKLGRQLGVSGLTVSRWETTRSEISPATRRAVLDRLVKARSVVAPEVAKAFGLELGHNRDPETRRAELDLALLRTAEALDLVPSLVRKVARDVLARLDALDMGPKEALGLAAAKTGTT